MHELAQTGNYFSQHLEITKVLGMRSSIGAGTTKLSIPNQSLLTAILRSICVSKVHQIAKLDCQPVWERFERTISRLRKGGDSRRKGIEILLHCLFNDFNHL